ncbi:MAG TPA: PfkB family carbohydrate kinase [Tepidisphaeraceae bacterium]|nr:PfkB family carbohydrate kinase [Tepidisphaeraceae bacterium]
MFPSVAGAANFADMAQTTKLLSLEDLLNLRQSARADGRTVVHCHGCFDIVHPGHIHHLQYARSLGDMLVVSVTRDTNVNKGVARPLIPDDLRAASLAALECVDAVYLNPDPTAVELLGALQPDIYVKGREYEHNHDPRFLAERDAVTSAGGRIVFSSGDIVYSSTALISQMQRQDAFSDEKLRRFCDEGGLTAASLANTVHRFRGQKVVVIGDYILDRYHFCDATGVAGEAPMMALRSLDRRDYDGGAGVIAAHLAAVGAEPILVTALADDDESRQAEIRLRAAGIEVVASRHRRDLVTKSRFLADETKLFKLDEGAAQPTDSIAQAAVADQILAAAQGAAAVIFADFGYGLITTGLLDQIMPRLRATVPIITADVSGKQATLARFKDVDLLCPTEREMRETLQDFSSGLGAVVAHLLQVTRARHALVTLGKQGLVSFRWPENTPAASGYRLRSDYLPAMSARCVDPLGCGDALLAIASLALATGASIEAAAYLGSAAAGIEVEKLGNVPITTDELMQTIHERLARLAAA